MIWKKLLRPRWLVILCVPIAILFAVQAHSRRHPGVDAPWMHRIPGTDDITGSRGAMYVSPDERWITFFVHGPGAHEDGLVSLELATGERTEHNLDSFSARELGSLGPLPFMMLCDGVGGWQQGRFYLPLHDIALANEIPALVVESRTPRPVMVSDGPDAFSWRRSLESAGLHPGFPQNCSAPWRAGRYGTRLYYDDVESNAILSRVVERLAIPDDRVSRVQSLTPSTFAVGPEPQAPDGEIRKIEGIPDGGLVWSEAVSRVRVSPHESYLAYQLSYEGRWIPLPPPDQVLKVKNLKTGRTRTVCGFRIIRSVQWSADGRKLYLVGYDSDNSRSAYIADIASIFGD